MLILYLPREGVVVDQQQLDGGLPTADEDGGEVVVLAFLAIELDKVIVHLLSIILLRSCIGGIVAARITGRSVGRSVGRRAFSPSVHHCHMEASID
jgi:hypothetical protein